MPKIQNEVNVSLNKFQTQWNRTNMTRKEKPNFLPSLTTPDQTLTIPQIMTRFASGLPLGGQRQGFYDGEGHDVAVTDDILLGRNWDTFDLSEKHDILKKARTDFDDLNKGIKDKQEAYSKAAVAKHKSDQEKIAKLLAKLDEKPE